MVKTINDVLRTKGNSVVTVKSEDTANIRVGCPVIGLVHALIRNQGFRISQHEGYMLGH